MSRLFKLLLLLVFAGQAAHAQQTFQYFRPSNGILVGQNNTYVTTPATSSNVISLWTGTCNATTFLRADGSCQIASAVADPTATIGLTPINGVATTALRSDGAPALSQAIAPNWSAMHTFSQSISGATTPIFVSSATPGIDFNQTSGAANNRRWRFFADSEEFSLALLDDAVGSFTQALFINRTNNTVDSIGLTATALNWNGSSMVNLASNPTWTGKHIFTGTASAGLNGFAANFNSAAPGIQFNDTDSTANNRIWDVLVNADQIAFRAADDSYSVVNSWMTVNRTGAAVDGWDLAINGNTLSMTGSVLSTAGSIRSDKVFTTGNLINYGVVGNSTSPAFALRETDATTNNQIWDLIASGEQLSLRVLGDGALSPANILNVTRTGTTVQTVAVTANNFTFNGAAVVTAATTTASASTSGCVSNPSASMRFTNAGGAVTARINVASCTSNATTYAIPGAIPVGYRPIIAGQECVITIRDNNVKNIGYMVAETNGDINFYTNTAGGTWTNSGTKDAGDTANVSCTWNVN